MGDILDWLAAKTPIAPLPLRKGMYQAADELSALRDVLSAMCAAQQVEPYRGWNLTALNMATDKARALLGLQSVRDLNPDIAAMQDHAAANKDALRAILSGPQQGGEDV